MIVDLTPGDVRGAEAADPRGRSRSATVRLRRIRPMCCDAGSGRCCSSRSRRSKRRWRTRARSASCCAIACRDGLSATRSAARSRTTTRRASRRIRARGENNTFYLQALATLPTVQNQHRARKRPAGRRPGPAWPPRASITSPPSSTERVVAAGPEWLPTATVPRSLRELPAQRNRLRLHPGGFTPEGGVGG